MAIDINRNSGFDIPAAVSTDIIQKTLENSAVMQLARQVELPGNGVAIPVVTGDADAAWVGETEQKGVKNATVSTKTLRPYKMAVVEPFSNEFTRDASALYSALVARLPYALATLFDNTIVGGATVPGSDFDTLDSSNAVDIKSDTYGGLVNADTAIAGNGYTMNGVALSPQGRGILLAAVDSTKRPLFVNNVSEGAIPRVLGVPVYQNKGVYKADTNAPTVGVAGDWTQAVFGTVNGIEVAVSDQASLTLADGKTVNLWQNNMVAVRCEMEVGFRCDTSAFIKLTA
jgi:HK97 family phage major capsid protein